MSYKPSFSQSLTLDGLKRWISSELVRISNALVTSSQKTKLEVATAEPAKPQTGEVILADGTDWNPSNGRGLYYYDAGWQQVGSGSGGGGIASEVNDLTTSVTWATVPDTYIQSTGVTQHQAALSITESQISDLGTYLTTHQDISGKANLSGATFTGLIGSPNIDISTGESVVTNIQTAVQSNQANTKTINIGTGYHNGGNTIVNIGPSSGNTNKNINLYGSTTFSDYADFNSPVYFNSLVDFFSDASNTNQYDQLISFKAKISSTTHAEAGRVAVVGNGYAPSKLIIGQDKAAITFFDGFGSRYIHPVDAGTGLNTNGLCDLGSYSARFKLGRFSSGTTTSSDRNEKRDIEELTEAELRVAARCKPLLRKYRRKDAYEWKGEEARVHFGIIAQDLEDAFTAEGLDAHRYAMFMEDTWYETEEGGTTYLSLEEVPQDLRGSAVVKTLQGVRYEQLLAFIVAAI